MRFLRPLAVLLASLLLALGVTEVRLAASPQGAGFRHPMAPAPGGAVYAADPRTGYLVLVDASGGRTALAGLPAGLPVTMASDPGDPAGLIVLGTDRGLAYSNDGGRSLRPAPVPRARYTATWSSGQTALAGAWAGPLYRTDDGGATWQALPISAEWQVIAPVQGELWAATLTGVLRSPDGGQTWTATGLPSRVTSLTAVESRVLAVRWDGTSVLTGVAGDLAPGPRFPAGVWALTDGLAGTVSGLADSRGPRPGLGRREVTALVASGAVLYAGLANGPVLASVDGGAGWRAVLEG